MAKVLVLGSSGLVGRAVVMRMGDLTGVDVLAAGRSGEGLAQILDATDPPPLEPLVEGADLVVNAIGVLRGEPDYPSDGYVIRATRVNSVFPLLLARAAVKQGSRVLHVSTDAVFGPGETPADERSEIGPTEPYGLTKALGETDSPAVVNVRCSVVGPAPGRRGLWEWLLSQPQSSEVQGFSTPWTGVTSRQLAVLCGDLVERPAFDEVRAAGSAHHFVPNEAITKFELLSRLRDALRPDLTVQPAAGEAGPQLTSSIGALDRVFSGARGWDEALKEALEST